MDLVEQILEASQKLVSIEQFCEFCEDILKITKCKDDSCGVKKHTDSLMKVMFDPEQDYDYKISFLRKSQLSILKCLVLCSS